MKKYIAGSKCNNCKHVDRNRVYNWNDLLMCKKNKEYVNPNDWCYAYKKGENVHGK